MTDTVKPQALHPYLREFLEYLQVERGASKATVDAYRRDIQQHLRDLAEGGVTFPDGVNCDAVTGWLDALRAQGARPSTAARKTSALRRFYGYLTGEGYLTEDPSRFTRNTGFPKRFKGALTLEEMQRLLDAVEQEGNDALRLRDQAMIELLYATGLRVSELLGLRPGDLNMQFLFLRVMGKGGKERLVPFHEGAAAKLAVYTEQGRPLLCAKRPAETLFVNKRGGPLSRMGFWKILRKYALLAGITTELSPHTLRHTFATHLLHNDVDLRILQELLGHADIGTTEIYTHLDERVMRELHQRFHPRNQRR